MVNEAKQMLLLFAWYSPGAAADGLAAVVRSRAPDSAPSASASSSDSTFFARITHHGTTQGSQDHQCRLLLAVAIAGTLYLNRPESSAATQSTDDAYVQPDFTTVAPQVSGTVTKVLVEDNQAVKAGDLLATIDDRDFVVAVDAAKARVASAQASIASLQAHLVLQETAIRQAQAAVAADDASLKLAKENQVRYRNLSADGSGTVQALQQAEAQLSIQLASREKNQAGVHAARQRMDILKADLENARAALEQAQSAQSAAELKLSYTRITAPVGGMVGQKSVRVGAFVNVGQPLLAIVPLDNVYITANFRETQLARVQAGQAVASKWMPCRAKF